MVPTPNPRGLIHFSATAHDSQVVLIILIANQFFIKIADSIKKTFFPTTVNDGIHIALVIGLMRTRPANGKCGMEHRSDRSLLVGGCSSAHRSPYVICPGLAQYRKAFLNVVGRIVSMGVHANNDFSSS